MESAVAPAARERPRPLQVEVQVVLGRVADRTVALECGATRLQGPRRRPWPWPSTRAAPRRDRRPRSTRRLGTRADAANSRPMRALARWCLTAWNDPTGTPNCLRSARSRPSSRACGRPTRIAGRRFRRRRDRGPRAPLPRSPRRVRACPEPRRGAGHRRPTGAGPARPRRGRYRPPVVKITSAVSAHGTHGSPAATVRSVRPSSGTPKAAVSTMGSGTA